jgi:hypothetical protein
MHDPAVLSRALPPFLDRPFVEAKGFHNRLQWTAVGQQGNDQQDGLGVRSQTVEDGTLGGAEGLLTHLANVALLLSAMNTDVPFSDLPSCGAVNILAKYCVWVHWLYSYGVKTTGFCR